MKRSRWGTPTATLLLKNIPDAVRPPAEASLREAWAHQHVCHNGFNGHARCFKVSKASYTADKRFTAWPVFEQWLKAIGGQRVELTYEAGIGFGLRARTPFKKGERVVSGTAAITADGRARPQHHGQQQ